MIPSASDAGTLVRERTCKGQKTALISLLSDIQDRYHYLPHNTLVLLSEALDIPLSQIYSVATFYNAFSLKPRGAHIVRVCMGTACHVRGAPAILHRLESKLKIVAGETTRDRQVTLETVNCLGACALGPVTVIDGAYSGQMDIAKVDRLLKGLARAGESQHD
jgi:NADH-quinone oxidoreductase subunit E